MRTITDYELGNFAIYNIGDRCLELAHDCKDSHPDQSKFLGSLGYIVSEYGQNMEETGSKETRALLLEQMKIRRLVE